MFEQLKHNTEAATNDEGGHVYWPGIIRAACESRLKEEGRNSQWAKRHDEDLGTETRWDGHHHNAPHKVGNPKIEVCTEEKPVKTG